MWHEPTQSVLIDTDIGDDVDDAFGLALALRLPQLRVRGVTTVSGPVQKRAKLAQSILTAAGHADIPVEPGSSAMSSGMPGSARFSHQPVLEITDCRTQIADSDAATAQSPSSSLQSAIDLILACSHASTPLTIIALGPLT